MRLPALLTSPVSPRAWLGLSSSRLVRNDYLALPVGAAAGPSHQPGKAPEHGWACRAADYPTQAPVGAAPGPTSVGNQRDWRPERQTFKQTVPLSLSVLLPALLTSRVGPRALLGLSSSRLDRIDYPTPVQSVQPTVRPAWKAIETGDLSDRLSDRPSRSLCRCCCRPFSSAG